MSSDQKQELKSQKQEQNLLQKHESQQSIHSQPKIQKSQQSEENNALLQNQIFGKDNSVQIIEDFNATDQMAKTKNENFRSQPDDSKKKVSTQEKGNNKESPTLNKQPSASDLQPKNQPKAKETQQIQIQQAESKKLKNQNTTAQNVNFNDQQTQASHQQEGAKQVQPSDLSSQKRPSQENQDAEKQVQTLQNINTQLIIKDNPQVQQIKEESIGGRNSIKAESDVLLLTQRRSEESGVDIFNQQNDQFEKIRFPTVQKFLDHKYVSIFVTVITIYALFGDDIRVMATHKSADNYFDAFTIIAIIIFGTEIILSIISKVGYFNSFFFWLDIISTISLLFDIQIISQSLFSSTSVNASQIAKAGKASRVGTRAGRIVRLVRLIRIVKLYKKAQEVKQEKEKILTQLMEKKKNMKKVHPNQNPLGDDSTQHVQIELSEKKDSVTYEIAQKQLMQLQVMQDQQQSGNQQQHSPRSIQNNQILSQMDQLRIISAANQQRQTQNPEHISQSMLYQKDQLKESQFKKDSLNTPSLNRDSISSSCANPNGIKRPSIFNTTAQNNKPQETSKNKVSISQNQINVNNTSTRISQVVPLKTPSQLHLNKEDIRESRVSQKLSDLTTKRVISIVLLLLFIMPLFSSNYFFDPPSSIEFAVKSLEYVSYDTTFTKNDIITLFRAIITEHSPSRSKNPIVKLCYPGGLEPNFEDPDYKLLRPDELDASSHTIDYNKMNTARSSDSSFTTLLSNIQQLSGSDQSIQGYLNKRSDNVITAGLSLGRTIYVCIVLTLGALMFSQDANNLAIEPIERMIKKVNQIARNPISSKELEINKSNKEQYETIIIENAIVKIGTLLALGFGDAGSEIIASNMAKTGDVDPMLPGKKKCAIYGFCDIRNFTDTTEVLQEQVLIFVNNIGEVVHNMVDRFQGAANKNIGDAFLLVWKIQENKYELTPDNQLIVLDSQYVSTIADLAVVSFIKINAKLNREPHILAYRQNKKLSERMPNYKVKMGFGLHIGWSIEGAIGSVYKIDASYLSPNVNMASRLEAATKQFGTSVLISSDLHNQCSEKLKAYTRQIDEVTVKGSIKPMGLFTVDLCLENLPPSKSMEEQEFTKQERYELDKEKKRQITELVENNSWDAVQFIQQNKDLRLVFQKFNPTFLNIFNQGFQLYIKGKWEESLKLLEESLKLKAEDGPTLSLLAVMKEFNFKAPNNWPGYRVLTEK